MVFYYIRHGDPIYNPDSLTELGKRQAEAAAKRLALLGVDKIYSSTSERAKLTAKPACKLVKKDAELLDFAKEDYVWQELSALNDEGTAKTWLFRTGWVKKLFRSKVIRELGDRWFDHPDFKQYNFEKGINRIYDEADKFFASLGYEHIRYSGSYKVTKPNNQKIAFFAHQGFASAFFSCMLDIPYPMFCTHFDTYHTGITVVEFNEQDGYATPVVKSYSSDGHLYREGLPTTI